MRSFQLGRSLALAVAMTRRLPRCSLQGGAASAADGGAVGTRVVKFGHGLLFRRPHGTKTTNSRCFAHLGGARDCAKGARVVAATDCMVVAER